ncbi:hypothetical protein VDG1235_3598 [Verrucomicrobiia bacterium DG1235]|nr:hypothetical protein VDG1235_3598 [Verrucomicrobiae bacterium DG1235]
MLGCVECGESEGIDEELYEELYELSFSYDQLKAGEIVFEIYRDDVPDAYVGQALDRVQKPEEIEWKCASCGESSPKTICECWNCGYVNSELEPDEGEELETDLKEEAEVEVRAEPPPAQSRRMVRRKPQMIRLSNGVVVPMGIGIVIGVFLALGIVVARALVDLPGVVELLSDDWEMVRVGNRWEPFASAGVAFALGTALGAWLSLSRFPKRVSISPRGVEVAFRGGKKSALYGFDQVRAAKFTDAGNYLTLTFWDGKAAVVAMGKTPPSDLRYYFRGNV